MGEEKKPRKNCLRLDVKTPYSPLQILPRATFVPGWNLDFDVQVTSLH
jgi:hypothetical protein